jgi:DNA-binding beta-propeller fold protein YncE
MGRTLFLWIVVCSELAAQWWAPPPHPTGLSSQPFFIRNIWYIGGVGPWDTMSLDPAAGRLYIAHGPMVQVVDVRSGTIVGEIRGLAGARAIALDNHGAYGYISDGRGNRVVVFDRHSLQTVAAIPTGPDPRSLVYEPHSGLVFVVGSAPPGQRPLSGQGGRTRPPPATPTSDSFITVIDPQNNSVLGRILVSGRLGLAQADGSGQVYVGSGEGDAMLHFNAEAVAAELRNETGKSAEKSSTAAEEQGQPKPMAAIPPLLDWTEGPGSQAEAEAAFHEISLGHACGVPHGFALDGQDSRMFVACSDMNLEVINTATAQRVIALPIGSGVDEVGYDPVHGYIFAADGAGDGTLTIIRRDSATDTYAIVQNVPTRQRAYVMAVDPENGGVYLVTDIIGADLTHPGGIGALRMKPINGSFQVIQIGN